MAVCWCGVRQRNISIIPTEDCGGGTMVLSHVTEHSILIGL